jgi:hypothetical protein
MIIWVILAIIFVISCLVGGGYSVGYQDGYIDAKNELKGDKDKGEKDEDL